MKNIRWVNYQHRYPAICVVTKADAGDMDDFTLALRCEGDPFMKKAIVVQHPTPSEAREEAGTIKTAFSFGRFVIYGNAELVEQIRSRL